MRYYRILSVFVLSFGLLALASAQEPTPPATASVAPSSTPAPPATFKANSRMVTLEVVARDHHGQPVQGLTAEDFQIVEQVVPKHDQHPQKVAAFRAVSVTEIAAEDKGKIQLPPGVYTNLVSMEKYPVPPTILLVDGLNTDRGAQMQVHRQMIKMLASIPEDVPVAVFLLGRSLKMIQNFTTDPKLLKAALQKAQTTKTDTATQVEPVDDPDTMSALLEDNANMPASSLDALQQFEREVYAAQMDTRIRITLDALRSIGQHVAGYPGRKNLLWVSSSFPIAIDPDVDLGLAGIRVYQDQMAKTADSLAVSKVAVYPMDPAGLQTQSTFQAGARIRSAQHWTAARA